MKHLREVPFEENRLCLQQACQHACIDESSAAPAAAVDSVEGEGAAAAEELKDEAAAVTPGVTLGREVVHVKPFSVLICFRGPPQNHDKIKMCFSVRGM